MPTKILIVGPAWVGDMVMAQTLFKLLKRRDPQVIIDVLAPEWSRPLLERMPEVRKSFVMPLKHGEIGLATRYAIGKTLRAEKYDQAIMLPNSFKSALTPWFANIPVRTGWRGEMRYVVLNDVRILDPQQYPLMIERFMALGLQRGEGLPKGEKYPVPELQISAATRAQALTKYNLSTPTKPILALCPGAEFGPSKRWPEEYYAEVAKAKIAAGWDVWIFGSPKDLPYAEFINQATGGRCANLAGRTNLADAIDLLSLATVIVSNDSGLMHIGAALKRPLVVVYGSTSYTFTPPLHDQAKILQLKLDCQPCFQRECPLKHHNCMRQLTADYVLKAIAEFEPVCAS